MKTIDLSYFRSSKDIITLSGRPKGQKGRKEFDLDTLDNKSEIIIIKVPEEYKSISTSFILGMFGQSMKILGETSFFEKYKFEGKNIDRLLNNCMTEATKREI